MNTMNTMNRGFTMIELLVVIAIIGLMSSIVLAAVTTARMQGRDARRAADLRQLRYALELYALDHNGHYPYTGTVWRSIANGQTYTGATGYVPSLAGQYISVLPADPSGNTASYEYTGWGDGSVGAGSYNYKLLAVCESYTATTNPFPDPQPSRPTDATHCNMAVYTTNASPTFGVAQACQNGNANGLGATCW